MYYGSESGGRCCIICSEQTLSVHSPGRSTLMHEITSWPPSWVWRQIENRLRLSMRINFYLKNNPAKFHPFELKRRSHSLFFEEVRNNNKKNKMSGDMRSVADAETSQAAVRNDARNLRWLYNVELRLKEHGNKLLSRRADGFAINTSYMPHIAY